MKRRNRQRWVPSLQSSPTDERLHHAGTDYAESDDKRGDVRIVTMRDAPLERLHFRGLIDIDQYNAGVTFRHHWHQGGLDGLSGMDMVRVAAGTVNFDHLAKTEAQAHHRRQFFLAMQHVGAADGGLLWLAICCETPLQIIGNMLGWNTVNQARAAATERVRSALYRLQEFWA